MIAVDTCILVRYAIRDDLIQARTATEFLKSNNCFIYKTVLLEFCWVLSSASGYNLSRPVVAERMRHICGLPTISVEDASNSALAIGLFEKGMDFGDALHLTSSSSFSGFATFDKKLSTKASKLLPGQQVKLLK